MHTPWADWELFLAVAERGSFTGAAAALGLTQPTVSRRVVALEERLGRPLFRRDVDGAHLTVEGERLLSSAQQMARWASELERTSDNWTDQPEGLVRITAPPGIAHDVLVPFARNLRSTLPDIRLELLVGIDTIDLSRGQAELAVRSRKPTQPDLMLVATLRVRLGVFVSKTYAERLTPPISPAALDWVSWSAPNAHLTPRPELEALIPDFRPAFASNDYVVQQRAVAEGLGAMILSAVRHADEPYGVELVEVPMNLPLPVGELYVVCAKTMRWVPRVQAVISELLAHFERVEGTTVERALTT